jgi:hypothetical protein
VYASCEKADKGNPEKETTIASLQQPEVYLRVSVTAGRSAGSAIALTESRRLIQTAS